MNPPPTNKLREATGRIIEAVHTEYGGLSMIEKVEGILREVVEEAIANEYAGGAIDQQKACKNHCERAQAMKKKHYPTWVCWDCGTKASGIRGYRGGCSTYHDGVCEVCWKEKAVTQPRDFGYPEFKP